MRLSKQDRDEVVRDLKHWGYVARRRWRAEPKRIHPLARIMEYGRMPGPKVYSPSYEYERDQWFLVVNQTVMQMGEMDRALIVAHYMDGKDWRVLRKLLNLKKWWEVGRELKAAETRYFCLRFLDNAA